jgi:pimeloyl-ACP methyl ester carboxylesterase
MDFTVDGKKAFAYTAAHTIDPAKPAIVFLHGAGLDHSWFGLQSRYFGYHGFNVLAADFPGHGRSAGPPLKKIEAMADWAVRLLDAARIDRAAIVGHSMGALTALECAAGHAARVTRIALLGLCYPMKVNETFLEAAHRNEQAAYDMDTIWGHAPQVPFGGNPNPGMWMYGDNLARLARLAPGVLYAGLKACTSYAGGEKSAAKVDCPVLFIVGSRDQMTPPRVTAAYSKAFKSAQTVVLPRSGHSLMAEAPDGTLDALIDYFSTETTQ